MNKGVVRPVRGIGDFDESRVESGEPGMENLPSPNKGPDIERRKKQKRNNLNDEVEKGLGGGGRGRRNGWSGGGGRHLRRRLKARKV